METFRSIDVEILTSMFNSMNVGIYMVDNTGKTIFINEKATKIFNLISKKIIGKHLIEIFPSLNKESCILLKVLKDGEPFLHYKQTNINYKGEQITTINSTYPVVINGKIVGAFSLIRDIPTLDSIFKKFFPSKSQTPISKKFASNKSRYSFEDIIGQNQVLLKTLEIARKVANTKSPVWIYGETGTGKELLVQSMHSYSYRNNKPFVAQNCAALPNNLLESILFGTTKGSFTGAIDKPGLFEIANGGVIFLDEIQSMTIELQSKLLRVLQENVFRRIGDYKEIPTDIKIIVGSNIDPREALKHNIIREDLYYRLCVVTLRLPPLRERKDDMPLLVRHFIYKYNSELGLNVKDISKKVLDVFMEYNWPGNIRQLENAIESAMNIMDGDVIHIEYLPQEFIELAGAKQGDNGNIKLNLRSTVESVEKEFIIEAIEKAQGNITEAAKILGIPRQTLHYKLNILKIEHKS